jgi:hypothetical protein
MLDWSRLGLLGRAGLQRVPVSAGAPRTPVSAGAPRTPAVGGNTSPASPASKVMLPRRHIVPIVLGLAAAGLVAACTNMANDAVYDTGAQGTTGTGGPSATAGAGGGDASIDITADAPPDGYDPRTPFAHLCGVGECALGVTPSTCDRSPGPGEGGAGGGVDGAGGGDADGGAGGTAVPPVASLCKLAPGEDGVAEGTCLPSGENQEGQVCASASDCAAGLGCEAETLKCRPYCCGDVEACPAQTFCAPRPMAEETSEAPTPIPLCVPVTDCVLLDTTCGEGQTCSIVREDGTTSCVPAGTGEACDDCSVNACADGFICSKSTNRCLKLCHVNGSTDECMGGFCTSGSMAYPEDIGVCAGGPSDC